jgi:5-methyltetrahydropteroyltriglutamate--homocysteine methyltransferase
MKASEHRILTTHMGSLPRGEALTELLLAEDRGSAPEPEAFRAAVEGAMAEVVDAQVEAGVDIGCDGEVPRISFSTYVATRMSGFGGVSERPLPLDAIRFPKWRQWMSDRGLRRARLFDAPQAIAEVRYEDFSRVEHECEAFESCLAARPGAFVETFMTAASPGIVATTMMNKHYETHEAYLFALARELRKEYETIVGRGYLLQIDAPDLAMERACFFQDNSLSEFQGFVEMHIAAINAALEDIPADRVRLHACWGNRNSPHSFDVPCADILALMYEARVGALCLPFGNPRHAHEVESLRRVPLPEHMALVAGVIDTTTNYVEHPEVVAERVLRAVAAVGARERVIAGTDCGFGTLAGDSFVAEDVVWAKLASLREGANLASERLWRGG